MDEKPMLPKLMHWLLFVAAAVFVVLGMSVDRVAGISYHLLLLLAVVAIFMRGRRSLVSYGASWKTLWPLYLAVSGFTICLLLSQTMIGNGSVKDFNIALRFQGFMVLCWAFSQMPQRFFRWLGTAFALATLVATVKIYWLTGGGVSREHVNFMPILAYSELAAILGTLAVFSIKWDTELPESMRKALMALKLLAGLCGIYCIYLYQSRGAWLAIPIFVIVGCVVFVPGRNRLFKISAALLVMIAIATLYSSSENIRQRLMSVQSDLVSFESRSDLNTSVGTRLQLWNGSLRLYREHPFIGVGVNGYSNALGKLAKEGIISPEAAYYPHSHNEFLFIAVVFGTCGVVALLALYLVPVVFFCCYGARQSETARVTAMMGLVLCLAFVSDGLVDVMFIWRECSLFYTVLLSLLMAALLRWRKPAPEYLGTS
ncbi:O-antigen ligase [Herbaspirillum sp. VT-16-41]|uniref:O-antigen ligase family protein n=1 Tax=Herbaspirillum sp. VT-16-41 TaxID=1953765 RepID=UPI0009D3F81A|nr:O-antigen ligase family protein [Herbaspirillum sp. VT-16-41]ONN65002.1 hypothetical protein BTM36_19480 [Herbaspirillum sp. VT-16-41]